MNNTLNTYIFQFLSVRPYVRMFPLNFLLENSYGAVIWLKGHGRPAMKNGGPVIF
jgi:hypothetical protein